MAHQWSSIAEGLLFIGVVALSVTAPARVILRQGFDDTGVFKPGPLMTGKASDAICGSWRVNAASPDDFTITTEQVASSPHALKVLRQTVDVNALILKTPNGTMPKVTVKALNLLGHWVDLGSGLSADEQGFIIFPPTQKVTKLTLDISLRLWSFPTAASIRR